MTRSRALLGNNMTIFVFSKHALLKRIFDIHHVKLFANGQVLIGHFCPMKKNKLLCQEIIREMPITTGLGL